MAELTNGCVGPSQLAIRITFLPRKVGDKLHTSPVLYFGKYVKAQMAFLAGGRLIWSHTIAAHDDTFEMFLSNLEQIRATDNEETIEWDSLCSPEIGIEARRRRNEDYEDGRVLGYRYRVTAYIDYGAATSGGITWDGPAMILNVDEDDLVAFSKRLVEEMRLALD